jgi:hypothetical protein
MTKVIWQEKDIYFKTNLNGILVRGYDQRLVL